MRALALLCVLVMGCASAPKVPPEVDAPKNLQGFDISRASIFSGDKVTKVAYDTWSGMAKGAATGCHAGGIVGIGLGAIGCLGTATIPGAPVELYQACVYLSAGVFCGAGALVGGAVGGVGDLFTTESTDG